ncbi:unnamed protein product [Tuber melanosporum]|uniref:(Perigord truffle) hypothetical protein n=1 Tax=Tuber melanosporum (strain Mel28) TaxID=656061 RepID=D5GAN6_TUBMM|nr:uncharacterized protein GSTUM_00003655001 [Tuber melanosporum]CAZ81579.1 unnamed protein product [Tuber melanosporum]
MSLSPQARNPSNQHQDDSSGQGERHSARNPACDLCREKKVRCGREKPTCQNCRSWRTACTYSERQKRDNEASRTAHRFEEVHDRLDRIETTMARLVAALESTNLASTPPPAFNSKTIVSSSRTQSQCGPGTPQTPQSNSGSLLATTYKIPVRREMQYLGPSSLMTLSSEAGSLAEEQLRLSSPPHPSSEAGSGVCHRRGTSDSTRVSVDGDIGASVESMLSRPEQAETVGALRKLSNISTNVATWFPYYGHRELRAGAGGANMGIPPRKIAEDLVAEYFKTVHAWFPLFEQTRFEEDMKRFYEGDKKLSEDRAWLVCFNNVMLFGMYDKCTGRKDIDTSMGQNFFLNAWAAIDDLEVFMAPRLRNVQALTTGVSTVPRSSIRIDGNPSQAVVAVEISRPGLCWSLMSGAARLATAIGLHRRPPSPCPFSKLELEERKAIFWNVYILDKCLSLTFGRSTCLPDFDCDTEMPEGDGKAVYFLNFIALIKLAKIQSNIYMRLYSAAATRQETAEKEKAILELDSELRDWWTQSRAVFDTAGNPDAAVNQGAPAAPLAVFSKLELKFSYLCSLTLVHRMARPDMAIWAESDNLCLESARDSIRIINEVVECNLDVANSGIIIWLFQYYPFTSFFILFSAVIRNPTAVTSKTVDFQLMRNLVSYLSRMQEKSEGAAKLLQIASAFTHVAGTFLKNYGKLELAREHAGKRKRTSAEEDILSVSSPHHHHHGAGEEAWLEPGGCDNSAFRNGFGKGIYSTTAFPADSIEQVFPTPPPPPPPMHSHSRSHSNSNTESLPLGLDDLPEVDLHAANFLRWPATDGMSYEPPTAAAASYLDHAFSSAPESGAAPAAPDLSLEALMAEPEGFQLQMEQAAMRGPLDFDWFSWDGQFD